MSYLFTVARWVLDGMFAGTLLVVVWCLAIEFNIWRNSRRRPVPVAAVRREVNGRAAAGLTDDGLSLERRVRKARFASLPCERDAS